MRTAYLNIAIDTTKTPPVVVGLWCTRRPATTSQVGDGMLWITHRTWDGATAACARDGLLDYILGAGLMAHRWVLPLLRGADAMRATNAGRRDLPPNWFPGYADAACGPDDGSDALACVDTWSAANRAAADGNGPALYGAHFAAVRAAKDAEAAYRLAESHPPSTWLTAATVAKLRAAADALERARCRRGGLCRARATAPRCVAARTRRAAARCGTWSATTGIPDVADVEWGVYVQIERRPPHVERVPRQRGAV